MIANNDFNEKPKNSHQALGGMLSEQLCHQMFVLARMEALEESDPLVFAAMFGHCLTKMADDGYDLDLMAKQLKDLQARIEITALCYKQKKS